MSDKVQSAIIISRTISRMVDSRPYPDIAVFTEEDPIGRIVDLDSRVNGEPLHVLVFLSESEVVKFELKLRTLESVCCRIVVLTEFDEVPDSLYELGSTIIGFRNSPVIAREFEFLARRYCSSNRGASALSIKYDEDIGTLLDTLSDQDALISIGRSLSLEKDPEKLLRSMLYLSKKITGADAGSIFLVEEKNGKKVLRFAYTHTFSRELQYEEFTMPIDTHSIAGYVAVTGRVLNIPDVYLLKPDDPIAFNADFDRKSGYRSRSMLVVPMKNHIDDVIGVIQLINSKERRQNSSALTGNEAFQILLDKEEDFETWVVPFHTRYEALMEAIASQAAIALENRMMIKRIQEQFEEFVKASVSAIESRDPATSGHSLRVASISVSIAQAINRDESFAYKNVFLMEHEIKEIELAALLHDFGKVYINPAIFLKPRKLFQKDLDTMLLRLDFLKRTMELSYEREERALSGQNREDDAAVLDLRRGGNLRRLDEIRTLLLAMNEPCIGDTDNEKSLAEIEASAEKFRYADYAGEIIPLVTDLERKNLLIRRGSLNDEERKEIQNHVMYSYSFVSRIPWPKEYEHIPEFVSGHHERLDGSGYPEGLEEEKIPLGARILALADVYDALSSPDRPYKKAIPLEKIIGILKAEASDRKLDPDLVDLFLREGLYRSDESRVTEQAADRATSA